MIKKHSQGYVTDAHIDAYILVKGAVNDTHILAKGATIDAHIHIKEAIIGANILVNPNQSGLS